MTSAWQGLGTQWQERVRTFSRLSLWYRVSRAARKRENETPAQSRGGNLTPDQGEALPVAEGWTWAFRLVALPYPGNFPWAPRVPFALPGCRSSSGRGPTV